MGSYGMRIQCLPETSGGNYFERLQSKKKNKN